MKLWQLIKSHLGPYRDVLLVVVVLQAVATFASLTLPTINALLIDNGVLQGFMYNTIAGNTGGDGSGLWAVGCGEDTTL